MKTLVIEDLLTWAYCHELPKLQAASGGDRLGISGASSWRMVAEVGLLGTMVDRSRGPVRLSDFAERDSAPHPDALAVDDAVLDLEDTEISMPKGFDALGDCQGLTPEERAEAHALGFDLLTAKRRRLVALMIRRAQIGNTPPWRDHGTIYRRPKRAANGRERWFRMVNASDGPGFPAVPKEVDGLNPKTQRPFKGAYRKFYLDPHPAMLVAERMEYQAWVLALHRLADVLDGQLVEHRVLPPAAPLWPWEGEEARAGARVLPMVLSTDARQEGENAA